MHDLPQAELGAHGTPGGADARVAQGKMTSRAGREIIPGTLMRDRLPHSEQRGGLASLQSLYDRHMAVGARPSLERARRRRTGERLAMGYAMATPARATS